MAIILQIIFWSGCFGLVHSYLLYPLLLHWLGRKKEWEAQSLSLREDTWPFVSVIMSVYNEESVIGEKLESLTALDYPLGKLEIFIGSDCSEDRTNGIVAGYAGRFQQIRFYAFPERRGKPPVINELYREATKLRPAGREHVLLITDASVILTPKVLRKLVRHFRKEQVAIVDTHMVHTGMRADGISRAESRYISSEGRLKYLEGLVWGKMIGPFGGCYAVRSDYFSEVPPNYLVDDFYITMRALERGGDAISDLEAICYEPVSHAISEEYRRKARISAGNFQNLWTFRKLWWPPFSTLGFAFFSHKVLRWLGPFFIGMIFLTSGLLAMQGNLFFRSLFVIMTMGAILLIGMDIILTRLGVHFFPARSIRYFLLMNLALFHGFVKFVKGIRSNVWEPPKRNQ